MDTSMVRTEPFWKPVAVVMAFALLLGGFSFLFTGTTKAHADTSVPVTVTIDAFVDGAMANATNANGAAFPMTAMWNASSTGSGSGPFTLSPTGFNSTNAYEAVTAPLDNGSSYAVNENTSGNTVVGASAADGLPFVLQGYTTGTSLAAAEAGTVSLTPPSLTNLTANEYVIVWNMTNASSTTGTDATGSTTQNGVPTPMPLLPVNGSTATSMLQTAVVWSPVVDAAGGITYVYQASNASTTNADGSFTTAILTSTPQTAPSISTPNLTDGTYYWHVQATDSAGAHSQWSPTWSFTINNGGTGGTGTTTGSGGNTGTTTDSGGTSGGVGGTVASSTDPGVLAVNSVTTVNGTALADGTYGNGWKYTFNITVPTNENHLAMKFDDWTGPDASSTIAAGSHMQISSPQADNNGATVPITAANTYSTPTLHITGDLDPATPGNQIQVEVDVAVPTGTTNGSYTTNYGVESLP